MTYYQDQSPLATGLRGRCPRCGEGHLFDGFLTVKPRCSACGLDLSFADARDGRYEPPFWVHAVIFGPLVLAVCLGLLRPMKGVMVALQYRHGAREGRLDSE